MVVVFVQCFVCFLFLHYNLSILVWACLGSITILFALIYSLWLLLRVHVFDTFLQNSEDENGLPNIQLEDLVGMIQNTGKSKGFFLMNLHIAL